MNDIVIIVSGTLMSIIMISIIVTLFLVNQKRLLKEKNRNQSLELDLHNKVLASIIDTQEDERKRLSQDLHDEMGAIIMSLNMNNHQLLEKCTNKEVEFHERLAKNDELIEMVAEKVRNVSHTLLPPSLRSGHLEVALEALGNLFAEHTDIEFSCHFETEPIDIPIKDQLALYRVVNEWFTNIVKHSKAKNVELSLLKDRSNYTIEIKDDGKGFNFDKSLKKAKGLGLMNIKGRLMRINATFLFLKNQPKGTTFKISHPIKE